MTGAIIARPYLPLPTLIRKILTDVTLALRIALLAHSLRLSLIDTIALIHSDFLHFINDASFIGEVLSLKTKSLHLMSVVLF